MSLQSHSSQRVVAVGSRSQSTAEQFARRFGLRAHASYHDLVNDPGVDVAYVATPHHLHLEHGVLALEAGKHALVEKPLATNASEARQLADAASAAGLFCMEAHWTTFLPKFDVLRQLLESDALGEIIAVVADFGEWFPPQHRIFRAELAGGPVLDLGTYLISLVVSVLGSRPDHIVAHRAAVGSVTGQTAIIMTYGNRQAVLHTTILANTPTCATIAGTRATIVLDGPFYQPGGFTLTSVEDGRTLRYQEPRSAHHGGLHYQAAEVARRISNGESESPLRPLDLSVQTIAVLDEVRQLTQDPIPDHESAAARTATVRPADS